MPTAAANGLELYYELDGPADAPVLVLVNGLGGQMIGWDPGFVDLLVRFGFAVLRFDNRDVGHSTWLDGHRVDIDAIIDALISDREPPAVPYGLSDMAADVVGLLDHLSVDRAHVFGVSMGGMIAQTVAIEHPDRVASLHSVMSTTGDYRVGRPLPAAQELLTAPPPRNRDEVLERAVWSSQVIGSPAYPDDESARRKAAANYDRADNPMGVARQFAAILTAPDRTPALGAVRAPTLVLHGAADPLITVSGGRATAEAIPDAELVVIEGMGHDLPRQLWGVVAGAVAAVAARAET